MNIEDTTGVRARGRRSHQNNCRDHGGNILRYYYTEMRRNNNSHHHQQIPKTFAPSHPSLVQKVTTYP